MIDIPKDKKYVVAFSGGADSALLAFLLKENEYSFRLVHCVHEESCASTDADEIMNFCIEWAQQHEIPISCLHLSLDQNLVKKKGTEAAERDARYRALAENLNQDEILLTGHHLDDSIESSLLNLVRGASINGLTGIPQSTKIFSAEVQRPLLHLSKDQIHQAAERVVLLYRHDSTNNDTRMSRNYMRHEVIPKLKQKFGAMVESSFKRLFSNMSECAEIVQDMYMIDSATCIDGSNRVSLCEFQKLSVARQKNLLHSFIIDSFDLNLSQTHIMELLKRMSSKRQEDFQISSLVASFKDSTLEFSRKN